jgi:hypothetical protein
MDFRADPYPFDPSAAQLVIRMVASGASLKKLCESERAPPLIVVAEWLATNPEFEAAYRRAREVAMELVADEMMVWAKSGLSSDLARLDRAPTLSEITAARRTQIAVKQWLMAKWAPDTFAGRPSTGVMPDDEPREAPAPAAQPQQPRISPRAFFIPQIAGIEPIGPVVLPRPAPARPPAPPPAPAPVANDGDDGDDHFAAEAADPPFRPSRRYRRAMEAIARKGPAALAARSRAPPG